MNIIDKIKSIFFPKPKRLPSGTQSKEFNTPEKSTQKNVFDSSYRNSIVPAVNTLDFAIDQYLSALLYQMNQYGEPISYNAVVSLRGMHTVPTEISRSQENALLKNLEISSNYRVSRQPKDLSQMPAFYHIFKGNARSGNYRIYLNCKGTNVPTLATCFINSMRDMPEFYFKINSQAQAEKVARSEQFVFYVKDDAQLTQIINKIQGVKSMYPDLFVGSKNVNPFLKTVDGYIAYTPDITTKNYVSLDGSNRQISQSFNTLLSTALEDSLIHCTNSMNFDDSCYKMMQIYNNDSSRQQLIQNMKTCLSRLAISNPQLQIKGLNERTNQRNSNIYR